MKRSVLPLFACLMIVLGALLPAHAQDSVFPLPADLYILTSDSRVIRIDGANGGQSYISPEGQPVTDFAIAPDGAWYIYRTTANNAVIVNQIGGNSGYVVEFDMPQPTPNAGHSVAWAPDASALVYLVPGGMRVAEMNAGQYGEMVFSTIQGPWVEVIWSGNPLVGVDAVGQATGLTGGHGQWTLTPLQDVPPRPRSIPSSLGPQGVTLENGALVPGTAGALAFEWGPVPPPTADNTLKPYALYFLMADDAGVDQVWQLPADSGPARAVTAESGPVTEYALAPDGVQIAYAAGNKLIAAALDGTNRREVADIAPETYAAGIDWSPDGTQIAFSEGRGVWIVPADGSLPPRLVAQNNSDQSNIATMRFYLNPRWSPDGARLLVNVGYYEAGVLGVVDIATGAVTELGNVITFAGGWTDDGHVVTWAAAFGYETPGMYLLDPAAPEATPVMLLDASSPVMNVTHSVGGKWYVLVGSTGGMGPNALRVLAAESPLGPFDLLHNEAAYVYLEQPMLAISGDPAGGTLVILAGLRNVRTDGAPFRGDLVIVPLSGTGSAVHIQTPRPVWDVRWGS